ncbi:unnamed protein product [Prunus armeniaca]
MKLPLLLCSVSFSSPAFSSPLSFILFFSIIWRISGLRLEERESILVVAASSAGLLALGCLGGRWLWLVACAWVRRCDKEKNASEGSGMSSPPFPHGSH